MPERRIECGLDGREWVLGNESNMSARRMSERFIECIDVCLKNWTKRKRRQKHFGCGLLSIYCRRRITRHQRRF